MIVRINTGKKPAGAVRYNEEKVSNGQAHLIGVSNYPKDNPDELSMRSKIAMLETYAGFNQRVSSPTLHISVAFHPSEKLDDEQLKRMGEEYMQKMGYGNQPMLIYRHEDTHHPHMHIVSVSVDIDGKKISDSNNRPRSNAIRKEMEIKYQLVKAEEQGKQQLMTTSLPEQMLSYGEGETKKAIGSIVRTAFTDYSFSCTDTFTQFLSTYNIQLNQLKGESKAGKPYQGISFQLTNGDDAISPAIKASSYSFAPTQERLNNRFKHGQKRIEQAKPYLLQNVQKALEGYQKVSEVDYKNQLRSAGIQVLDTGKEFMYVDHHRRTVYGESELDSRLSRKHLLGAFVETSQVKLAQPLPPQSVKHTVNEPKPVAKKSHAAKTLSEKEAINLRKQVGRHYQTYRKEAGQYFESQTIERFPFEVLVEKLQQEGTERGHAQTAVRLFEQYKQSQLAEIKSKEESYFLQTGGIYVKLATQMPITAQCRINFLESVNLRTESNEEGQTQLVHRHNSALKLSITADQTQALLTGGSRAVAFPATLGKADREVFLAAASGQLPESASFYEVNGSLLKGCLPPPLYESISTVLNKNYLQQVMGHCQHSDRSLAEQLLDRGIIVEKNEQGFRAGFSQTNPATFTQLPSIYGHQLEREGLPNEYAQLAAGLHTVNGRLLVQAAQSADTGNQSRLERLRRQLPESVGGNSLPNAEVIAKLREQLLKPAAPTSMRSAQQTNQGINRSESDSTAKALQDALWKDYFQFRGRNGYFYESALLQKPAEFPITRLVQLLTSPPHQIEPMDAIHMVQAFQQNRLNRLDSIIKRDQDHFALTSQGFLTMINQAPLSGPDRQKALKAFYLDIHRNARGELELVHHQHKTFRTPLSETDTQSLIKGAPPDQIRSIALPTQEFPRHERALYEQIVLGKNLTKSKVDKEKRVEKPSFRNIMGERAKILLSDEQWERASRLLNEHTAESLLKDAPLAVERKVDWLYQRGMVIAPTKEGYRMGHYLTDPNFYHPVPESLVKLLESHRSAGAYADHRMEALLQTDRRLTGLTTERGKAMLNLAQALDQKNNKRVDYILHQLVHKVPSLAPLVSQPEKVLDYLSNSYGPFQENKVNKTDAVPNQPVMPVPAQDQPGGLLEALAEGTDTSQMRKKQRVGQPLRKLRPRR
ncbi:relaxase/mobilization nuclease domain-containing protein [Spirosoma lituiforme]